MEWSWLKDWWRLKSLRKRRKLLLQRNNLKHHRHQHLVDGVECKDPECMANNHHQPHCEGASGPSRRMSTTRQGSWNEEEDEDDVEDMCYCDECIMNVINPGRRCFN